MTRFRLLFQSLRYYWRTQVCVLLGMAVGTAVLSGALVVGDSVRGSLREITLERLGAIDFALSGPNFFSEALADRLAAGDGFDTEFVAVAPAIMLQASMEAAETGAFARDISLIGADERFWDMQSAGEHIQRPDVPATTETGNSGLWINASLATELDVAVGDTVLLRFAKPDPIPAEAVHGRRMGGIQTLRVRIEGVLTNRGFGRFGLRPGQQLPRNVFLPLSELQTRLDQADKINSILVAGREGAAAAAEPLAALQQRILRAATLEDLGLRLVEHGAQGYLALESLRMVLRQTDLAAAGDAAAAIGAPVEPTLTYLANSIEVGGRSIPYSTVSALNASAATPLGPLRLVDGSEAPALGSGEIYLNAWAAEALEARPGDEVRLTYYLSGPTGEFRDDGAADFKLRGIVAMEGLGADASLTPNYPGIHEARSIRDWDPPFPVDLAQIGDRDEAYWETYKALPKAFISLEDGTRLWTSRFGQYTALRMASAPGRSLAETGEAFRAGLHRYINPEFAGLIFAPVKALGLEASQGASDFGMLFLGFSFFIIFAAMLLVRLIFVLGVEQRAREIGILVAVGFSPSQVRRLFIMEGIVLALLGAVVGSAGGLGFAALMLHGLRTWWNASVGTTFLYLHAVPSTLALGAIIGMVVGVASVVLAIRRLSQAEPLDLVYGSTPGSGPRTNPVREARSGRREDSIAAVGGLLAAGCLAASGSAPAGVQAGLFYSAGVALLVACVAFLSARLRLTQPGASLTGQAYPVLRLGARNAARHRGRSLLIIGLMSSATFVIVTVGAMRKEGGHGSAEKHSGSGGFELFGQSDSPVLLDLNDPEGRFDLGMQAATREALAGTEIYALRHNPGEDASCLNLYQPSQPRILGVPRALTERGGFAFQGVMDPGTGRPENPWMLLDAEPQDNAIPAIADYNTVLWILHSGLGKTIEVRDGADRPVKLRFVALLKSSALQGEVLISEARFLELYPDRAGAEFFLIDTPPGAADTVQQLLERDLRPYGLDVSTTASRIESYHAVENTYLSTFQALGGLGLLLGTLGLTVVMIRGIVERRAELALLACVGYGRPALSLLVLSENFLLMISGLAIGFVSAMIASAPTLVQSGAAPHLGSLVLTLLAVLAVGMLSGIGGLRALSRLPVLESLRAP